MRGQWDGGAASGPAAFEEQTAALITIGVFFAQKTHLDRSTNLQTKDVELAQQQL